MKNLSFYLIMLLSSPAFFSCNGYRSITDYTNLGMSKREFMGVVSYPSLEYAEDDVEVYKKIKRVVRGGIAIYETHFFYFKNGVLRKIDTGTRGVDNRSQIELTVKNLN